MRRKRRATVAREINDRPAIFETDRFVITAKGEVGDAIEENSVAALRSATG